MSGNPEPTHLKMPERLTESLVNAVVRGLGLSPHQTKQVVIDLERQEVTITVEAMRQRVVRTYPVIPVHVKGVRIAPSAEEVTGP